MTEQRRVVVVFSQEPWGDIWYSKQHYAAQLAADHAVFFVGLTDRWRPMDLFRRKVTWQGTPEGVRVVKLSNPWPLRLVPRSWRERIARGAARRLSRILPEGELLIWAFHPTPVAAFLKRLVPGAKLIYQVVDDQGHDPSDRPFSATADLVLAVNGWFAGRYQALGRTCFVVPHGVRPVDRLYDPDQVAVYRQRWGRFILLVAGLNGYVDYQLLQQVSERFPDHPLLLLGTILPMEERARQALDRLLARANVHHLGAMPPGRMKDLVRAASVGLVAYDFEPTASEATGPGRTPLKAITYLSQHLPVVSTINSLIPELDGRGYFKAEDADDLLGRVAEVLEGRARVEVTAVDAYMDRVEYPELIRQVFSRLDAGSGEPGSALSNASTH